MWDLGRERPALLVPGDRVRFVDVASTAPSTPPSPGSQLLELAAPSTARPTAFVPPEPLPFSTAGSASALEVLEPGMLTLLQDLGRPGFASMGVSASGALDRPALREANRAVGNDVGTACLELTFGGLRLQARGPQVIAVTGAEAPLAVVRADGTTTAVAMGAPFALRDLDELYIGAPSAGVRSYLAVRGGFDIAPVLGSLATDVLAGLGPDPVAPGAVLPVRAVQRGAGVVQPGHCGQGDVAAPTYLPGEVHLDIVWGPRTDWFTADSVARLGAEAWTVSPRSDRVGLRLEGTALQRSVPAELPSEATVFGAIQVPPDGQPVLFLADHPITGGYPVIGAVASHHLARTAQLAPGARIRFVPGAPFAELG
jgi:biotin-dependent carboxylase-like uncharacterized protein